MGPKKIIFIIIGGLVIVLLIAGLGWYRVTKTKQEEQKNIAAIKEVTKEEIDPEIGKHFGSDYEIKEVTFYENRSWAVVILTPLTFTTDEALVVYKKEGDKWHLFLGPGTDFSDLEPNLLEQIPNSVKEAIGLSI